MNDRIKLAEETEAATIRLAEAMGITFDRAYKEVFPRQYVLGFNPFTDANDDYAVLEWMRSLDNNDTQFWQRYCDALRDFPEIGLKPAYQIGDYARAALKVLEGDSQT